MSRTIQSIVHFNFNRDGKLSEHTNILSLEMQSIEWNYKWYKDKWVRKKETGQQLGSIVVLGMFDL